MTRRSGASGESSAILPHNTWVTMILFVSVNTVVKYSILVAWALSALLFCATLDKVPDDPAVLKQLTAPHSPEFKHHSQPAPQVFHAVVTERASSPAQLGVGVLARQSDIQPPAGPAVALRRAADSSPPLVRS